MFNFNKVSYNCGRSTGANGTYFTNPGILIRIVVIIIKFGQSFYLAASPQRICNLQVERIRKDICQVSIFHRLVFG